MELQVLQINQGEPDLQADCATKAARQRFIQHEFIL